MNIENIIKQGETEKIEFKESFDKECIETAVAFANTKGGTIFIGINDKKEINGIQIGRNTLTEWINQIIQSTEPKITIKPQKILIKKKTVIILYISESRIKPISFKGRYFKRVGTSNYQMNWEDITKFVIQSIDTSWDRLIESRATIQDIDLKRVKRFIILCNKVNRRPIPEDEDYLTTLEKLELIQNENPTKAAILLFGKNPKKFYPQVILKIGRFKSENIIVDNKEIYGTLFEQIDEAMLYFKDRLQTKFEFTDEPQRKVIWEYPLEALRETIINAVCHRDYLDNANTQVRIYDEHILIWNPGKLPPELSLEQLKIEHPSRPHNPLIAEVFFYTGYIEKWGGGTLKIIKECVDNDLPEPEFSEDMGMFGVNFRKDFFNEKNLKEFSLSERQIKVVMYVKEKGRITNKEYQRIANTTKKTASRDLKNLVEKEIFTPIGITGRGRFYILKGAKNRQRGHKGDIKGT